LICKSHIEIEITCKECNYKKETMNYCKGLCFKESRSELKNYRHNFTIVRRNKDAAD